MSSGKNEGVCRLCGAYGALTFEHVPPKSAFNDSPLVSFRIEKLLSADSAREYERPTGGVSRRGSGAYTLCARCNNNTGRWYGSAYASWAREGLRLLDHAITAPTITHLMWLRPLEVLKQVACMFFSINGDRFRDSHRELSEFVLNPRRKYWPSQARIYVGLSAAPLSKMVGVSGIGNIETRSFQVVSEIAHPPFCYTMVFAGQPTHPDMYEISHFGRADYGEFKDYWVKLPVLTTATLFPGDYRSREEVFGNQTEGGG